MREAGADRALIYCADYKGSHSIEMQAGQWTDDVRVSDVEGRFVCTACGKRDADIRPLFQPARMDTSQ